MVFCITSHEYLNEGGVTFNQSCIFRYFNILLWVLYHLTTRIDEKCVSRMFYTMNGYHFVKVLK